MITVAIVSTNPNVANAIGAVILRSKAKYKHFKRYVYDDIKQCNIVLFDLDNISEFEDQIKQDSAGFSDIVAFGCARSESVLDDYRAVLQVDKKPFLDDHLKKLIKQLNDLRHTTKVVNADSDPTCSSLGISAEDLLSMDLLSDANRLQQLYEMVGTKYKGMGEKDFLDHIGASKISVSTREAEIPIREAKPRIDYKTQYFGDALMLYRAQKMKKLRFTIEEIEMRMSALIKTDLKMNESKDLFNAEEFARDFVNSRQFTDIKAKINDGVDDSQGTDLSEDVREDDIMDEAIKQRTEAIYHYDDKQNNNDSTIKKNNNFSETEVKYIKRSNNQQPLDSHSVQNPDRSASVTDQLLSGAELEKRLKSSLSSEQIKKLKKLGIKI